MVSSTERSILSEEHIFFSLKMEFTAISRLQIPSLRPPFSQTKAVSNSSNAFRRAHHLSFETRYFSFPDIRSNSCIATAKKKNSQPQKTLEPSIVEEVLLDEADDDSLILDDFDDEDMDMDLDDDYDFEEEFLEEDVETLAGDGSGGGGISLAGTSWDKEALAIAEHVCLSFDGDFGIYAFKTLPNFTIRVRIEKLSIKSGSPSIMDIEAFAIAYRTRLNEAEATGSIPNNISLEVSSPGVERVVRVPQDLDRFKERPMYVKYISKAVETGEPNCEKDGIFRLVSFDVESRICIWGIADVRINREKAGKGRPLNKKQRELRIETPFDSLRLVRLYSEI